MGNKSVADNAKDLMDAAPFKEYWLAANEMRIRAERGERKSEIEWAVWFKRRIDQLAFEENSPAPVYPLAKPRAFKDPYKDD